MIFEMHVNGPDNPGQIQYKDEKGTLQTIAIPDIVWAFESDKPVQGIADDAGHSYTEADDHILYIVEQNRKVTAFVLSAEEIEEFLENLKQANPNVIEGALYGRRLPLQMLNNCRDLGGIPTTDGRVVIPHKLLRSENLHKANKHDKEMLEKEWHLKTVIDFRTDWERIMEPDPIWLGVKHVHDPVFHESEINLEVDGDKPKQILKAIEHPQDLFQPLYATMVTTPMAINAWKKFFQILLEDPDGAILWHCTQGKDRTGLAAALLLYALGVDEKIILDDYLLTTTYENAAMESALEELCKMTGRPASEFANLQYLFYAEPAYFQTALDAMKKEYGSVQNYLEQAIGLDADKIETLKSLYLTQPLPAKAL